MNGPTFALVFVSTLLMTWVTGALVIIGVPTILVKLFYREPVRLPAARTHHRK